MKKLFIGLASASMLTAASAASAQVVHLNSATNPVGNSYTYSTGSGNVTATGYTAPSTQTGLYSKSNVSILDENGIGLVSDPSGQNEISDSGSTWSSALSPGGSFIQLDFSGLNAGTLVSFLMGSTTAGEGWTVFGTNTAGCGATVGCGTHIVSGTGDGVWTSLGVPAFTYYDFYATGTSGGNASNVLLGELNLSAVPEPATWAMMLIGFGAIGFAARRGRKAALAQLA